MLLLYFWLNWATALSFLGVMLLFFFDGIRFAGWCVASAFLYFFGDDE